MTIPAGTLLGRYEIQSTLGAGGMGEVYLASDIKLERTVALKLLPAKFADDAERMRRFLQEARAAAALNHPHIAHIYEIGEAEGTHFIAMEYVHGETLREKIYYNRAPLSKLLKYLTQVAEGLTKAHAEGIVHRDLKPDNIMVTHDGYAKILDFGLAKLVEPQERTETGEAGEAASGEASTVVIQQYSLAGTIMGTPGYMSPEQAQGREIDYRSDIFSFGCILYEAATGQRAFKGQDTLDSLHKTVYGPTPQIKDINPEAPDHLQKIIRRCLAKDANKRYHSIKDVAIELEELWQELESGRAHDYEVQTSAAGWQAESGSAQPQSQPSKPFASGTGEHSIERPASSAEYVFGEIKRHRVAALVCLLLLVLAAASFTYLRYFRKGRAAFDSIVVLPFVNASGDKETEFLSDGVTETLINNFTKIPALRIIARSTAFRYKGRDVDPQQVGRELKVSAILTGKVLQRGDLLNIQVDLIDATNGVEIWGEQYNGKAAEILDIQQRIARDVSERLRLQLTGDEERRATKRYTENAEAYQLYLKGRFFWNKRTGEALKKSVEHFNQAIEKDPNYALAFAGLADAYLLFPGYAVETPQEAYPKAKAAAKKALEIDETLAEAHAALGVELFAYEWKSDESSEQFRRAIELNPNYATAHHWYGNQYLQYIGRFDEAIIEVKRAQELDPLSLIINADLGDTYFYARQYDKAIEQLRKTIEMDESFYYAHFELGMAYTMKGSFAEAISEYRQAGELDDDPYVLALLGHAYAMSGRRDEALKVLDQLKEMAKTRYVREQCFILIYAGLGQKDEAFQWLETSYQNHSQNMTRLRVNPLLDNLRSDPRFDEMVRRVGL
ncbi:MAG TPA: protein kinase [Pyrinomonadaceae bacterium]|jgi:serine/threonine protein kinase/TolB-like protein/Flp pilus assembly protein TadD